MKASVWEYPALMHDDDPSPKTNPDEAIRVVQMDKLEEARKAMDLNRQKPTQHC